MDLTKKDIEVIINAIDNPKPPNQELIIAARKYKLGMYEKMAETAWEGCDGCDENDKYFFIKGYVTAMFDNEKHS